MTGRTRDEADPFGDVLPDRAADEGGRDQDEDMDGHDEWLRTEVPPHHL